MPAEHFAGRFLTSTAPSYTVLRRFMLFAESESEDKSRGGRKKVQSEIPV
jgi:hypothetical protein